MKLNFTINYQTTFGEHLQLILPGEGKEVKVHDLQYYNGGNWKTEVDYFSKSIRYHYRLINEYGEIVAEEFSPHDLHFTHNYSEYNIQDVWNKKNFPENYLNNKVLKNRLTDFKGTKITLLKRHSHLFRLEAPIYHRDWIVVVLGNVSALGEWRAEQAQEMVQVKPGIWELPLEIIENQAIEYKYGLKNIATQQVFDIEDGENRKTLPNLDHHVLNIQADHFYRFKSFALYHAAGVAVPVFALRSEHGFGVGEFPDLKLLADWARQANLSIIQTLPINDTTASHSWTDSYPYAPISLYALHPQYLSLENLSVELPKSIREEYLTKKQELNSERLVNYDAMMEAKWQLIRAVFQHYQDNILKSKAFRKFLKDNESWLLPYTAFCIQRDKYGTPNFNEWKTHKKYIPGKVAAFFSPKSKDYTEAMLHAWVQSELHCQLINAVEYIHSLGISVKGDLPIGIYRHSVEAWTEPELYGMDFQAGAPPDQFTELGQNWGFPTYNWEAMKADGYRWWKKRFHALEQYFDAMRIDHILGFFRIWRMPITATQGILGYFYPAVPVTVEEFSARHIPFDEERYCRPYINEQILSEYFGAEKQAVADHFLNNHFNGIYSFKEEYNTQRKLADYFEANPHPWLGEKLLSLCANVLFLREERDGLAVYHPRFKVHETASYRHLSDWEKQAIYELYIDYFFHRQDSLWYHSAMEKLPVILNATDMLICGEDLGLVPDCVPAVMDELAITALKVQRMPPGDAPYYNPENADYMNVVTASSHDSSTLRQWWHEDRGLVQDYFLNQLRQHGTAPGNLEPGLAEIIMKQHLYNDAMLAIFPIQEFFATDQALVNPAEDDERINNPAVFPHYWRYRMHITLEDLIERKDFSDKIAGWVHDSGRN